MRIFFPHFCIISALPYSVFQIRICIFFLVGSEPIYAQRAGFRLSATLPSSFRSILHSSRARRSLARNTGLRISLFGPNSVLKINESGSNLTKKSGRNTMSFRCNRIKKTMAPDPFRQKMTDPDSSALEKSTSLKNFMSRNQQIFYYPQPPRILIGVKNLNEEIVPDWPTVDSSQFPPKVRKTYRYILYYKIYFFF